MSLLSNTAYWREIRKFADIFLNIGSANPLYTIQERWARMIIGQEIAKQQPTSKWPKIQQMQWNQSIPSSISMYGMCEHAEKNWWDENRSKCHLPWNMSLSMDNLTVAQLHNIDRLICSINVRCWLLKNIHRNCSINRTSSSQITICQLAQLMH